jgi:hypothetical protein
MAWRFGTLGVGTLLTISLTTGCVSPNNVSDPTPLADPVVREPARERKLTPPPIVIPPVTEPDRQVRIDPPPPPKQEEIQQVQLQPAPLSPVPTARIMHAPPEANEPPVLAALRCLLEKQSPEALEALQKYDKRTQETLLAMLPLAARLSEGGVEKMTPQERAALLEQLGKATASLRGPAQLSVEKMCYCRRISNYGMYDPLADDHEFAGGVEKRHGELVQLYVEVRNFTNRRNGAFYETALRSKLEIRDKHGGGLAARMDFPAQPDHSLSPRQDYFIHYQFYVPTRMEPGDYVLTIELHDENAPAGEVNGPRGAQRTLPFRVVGPR